MYLYSLDAKYLQEERGEALGFTYMLFRNGQFSLYPIKNKSLNRDLVSTLQQGLGTQVQTYRSVFVAAPNSKFILQFLPSLP